MQQPNNIPIELECWMLKYGIVESERSPGFTSHVKVTQPKKESEHTKAEKIEMYFKNFSRNSQATPY
tara:strand:+ start:2577 stop:2777 length:201 start_codon:yes stop_codon:yes gene_type:complete